MVDGEHRSLSAEETMAEPSREPKTSKSETSKSEPEKKQPETVLLTAEELRAIAGGGGTGTSPPSVPGKSEIYKGKG
jgi:hypothetical protein